MGVGTRPGGTLRSALVFRLNPCRVGWGGGLGFGGVVFGALGLGA